MNSTPRLLAASAFSFALALALVPASAADALRPTPTAIVDRMLTLGKVGPGDHVIDSSTATAARHHPSVEKYKAKGGMGSTSIPSSSSYRTRTPPRRGGDRVKFVEGDLFRRTSATPVVTQDLLPACWATSRRSSRRN